MNASRHRLLRFAEFASWGLGLAGVVWLGAFQVSVARTTRNDLDHFAQLQHLALGATAPDQSLWAPRRVSAWQKAILEPASHPLAVLRIPKLRLEVAVLPGTDDRTLDRAVGHIEGTAVMRRLAP